MDKVIFRVFKNGEVIALFPRIAADYKGYLCQSYLHVGQHGAADPGIVCGQTKLSKPSEYKDLLKELKRIGYKLKIYKRFTYKDFQIRKTQCANMT